VTTTQEFLASDDNKIVLVELEYHNGTSMQVLYISNSQYVLPVGESYTNSLGNTVDNIYYEDILASIPVISSAIDQSAGIGNIEILNAEGDFDSYLDYAWEGHTVSVFIGAPNWARSAFIEIFSGKATALTAPTLSTLSLNMVDKQEELNVKTQEALLDQSYVDTKLLAANTAGDFTANVTGSPSSYPHAWNHLTGVIPEGSINKHIPICLGKCFNIEPVLIDYYNHVYQIHEDDIASVSEVRANGVVLDVSQYEVSVSTGLLRLLDHDAGAQITCDVIGTTTRGGGYDSGLIVTSYSAAQLIEWFVLEKTTLTASDIDNDYFNNSTGFTNTSELGIYINEEDNVLNTINSIISSVGGYARFNRSNNKLQIIVFLDPSGETSVLSIGEDEIIERGISLQEIELPFKAINIGYKRNWTVQDSGAIAGSVFSSNIDNINFIDQITTEYSNLYTVTAVTTAKYPLAKEKEQIPTLIYAKVDAQTELDRRSTLRSVKRFIYQISTIATPFSISIGDVVTITHSRYGLDSGVKCLVVGMREHPLNNRIILEVWK